MRLSSPYSVPKSWIPPQPAATPSSRSTKNATPCAISFSTHPVDTAAKRCFFGMVDQAQKNMQKAQQEAQKNVQQDIQQAQQRAGKAQATANLRSK